MEMRMLHLTTCCLALAILAHGQQDYQNPPGFISIDCGTPHNYNDMYLNITYNNDDGFVDSGMPMQATTQYMYDYKWPPSKNMRVFGNGKRNCYTLRPEQGKDHKYLIRASFWYGNYDGKNQPPTFDLHIDVNYWATVNSTSYVHKEIIYTPPRDYMQVCLVNIDRGVPFISAIELRLLNDSIYPIGSGALVTKWRYNMGSTNTYRYPYDEYDRIWSADTIINPAPWVSNTTDVVASIDNDDYKVPPEVLMTAEQMQNVNHSLSLFWNSASSTTTWYVYFHFAELQELNGQVRDMTIYEVYKSVNTSQSVRLENQKPVTIFPSLPMSGPQINFTIRATDGSTLPPLLNAVEIYTALDLLNSPSYLDDVNAISDIKKAYGVMRADWQGDPCTPRNYLWSGLNCNSDSSARIISVNLSASGLAGVIITSFSNLTAIVSLDLSNNNLNGVVPDFFAQNPNLRNLNLSGNNLSGSIPPALLMKKADGTLNLSLDGNPNLLTISQPAKKEKNRGVIFAIVSVSAAIIMILLSIPALFLRIRKKKIRGFSRGNSNRTLRTSKNQTFTSTEILKITDNFKTKIGQGGFGKVYFGELIDGTQVAVKVLSQSSKQGHSEFENEANLLMVLNHKNLVSLVGYCDESENMALVYEFMPNGNVRQYLSEHNPIVLTWDLRVQITVDIARGLEYLHNGCKPPIVHRDLKTSNILLNENLYAKIADFGLSKAFASEHDTHISTRPVGTPGYLDPEFHSTGNLNKKSDVYSFGIVLFELITGKPAIIRSETDSTHILQWVTPLVHCGDIQSIVDPRLGGQFDVNSARRLIEIAMSCVTTTTAQRPNMNTILSKLKEYIPIEATSQKSWGMDISTSVLCDSSEITPR